MYYLLCGLVFEKWAAARSVVSGSYAARNFGWVNRASDGGGLIWNHDQGVSQ
jgi:hypothetical protein